MDSTARTLIGSVGGILIGHGLEEGWGFLVLGGLLVLFALGGVPLLERVRRRKNPPSPEAVQQTLERFVLGGKHYQARHKLNEAEGALYLMLERRVPGSTGFRLRVQDPTGHQETKVFSDSAGRVVVRYPQDFQEASLKHSAVPRGAYLVTWEGLVQGIFRSGIQKLAHEKFTIV